MPLRLAAQPASRLVPAIGAGLAILIVCFQSLDMARKRNDAIAHAQRLSSSLTGMSAEYFARSFEVIDRALIAAADAFQEFRAGEMGDGEPARHRAYEALRAIHGGTPALIGIAWSDASGNLIVRSTSPARLQINNAVQPSFVVHREKEIGLYIADPVRSLVDGQWIVLISRRLRGADGEFLGVVQASLNVDHLVQTYGDLRFTDGGVVSLFTNRTGALVLYGAETRSHLGQSVADIKTFSDAEQRRTAPITRRTTALDGEVRILSYRTVGDFPLIAAVGFTVDGVLASWWRELAFTIGISVLLAAVLSGGSIVLGRLLARRERDVAVRRTAEIATQAKSEFLATVSHEIRTPLNGIIGYTELLADTALAAPQRHHLAVIDTSARTLLALLNDVLDFSRIEAGRLTLVDAPFDIAQTIDGAVSAIRSIATRKGLSLDVEMPSSLPIALGDSGRVRQILLNLLGNAIKFTSHGGVRLTVDRLTGQVGRLQLRIAVSDSGPGMDSETQARLFERFSQADSTIGRRFGGTGLGLAITKPLVEMMGGKIGIVSTPGAGSTFWFTLDLAIASSDAAAAVSTPHSDPTVPAEPRRVLVVDDMEVNRTLAHAILEKAGHHVENAADGAQALDKIRSSRFDVVLMDVNMPEMDGFEATARIRSLSHGHARIRIIALTASATATDIMRCRQVGMDGHVAKPIDRHLLLQAIETGSRWLNPAMLQFEREVAGTTNAETLDRRHLEELERYLGHASIAGMAAMAIKQLGDAQPRLVALAAAQNWSALSREGHTIVSVAGNLGAHALSAAFRRIEVEALGIVNADRDDRSAEQEAELDALIDAGLTLMRITAQALRERYALDKVQLES